MSDRKNETGRQYWQSIDQLLKTPGYKEKVDKRFKDIHKAPEIGDDGISRRQFLTLMSASLAMAGLAGCRKPVEKIVPYVVQPEEVIPGVPSYYATTMPFGNVAYGLVVESHEGRPTKIEGNALHPSTLGSSNSMLQAATLSLYDPDRSKKVLHKSAEDKYEYFVSFWRKKLDQYKNNKGKGLAILAESFSSPTLARLRDDLLKELPDAKWVTYEPISDENSRKAIESLTGRNYRPVYHYDKAEIILSLDADFLYNENENITAARGYANGRRLENPDDKMNRLYAVENTYTVTGGAADHRLRMSASHVGEFTKALVAELAKHGVMVKSPGTTSSHFDEKWLSALAKDLVNAKGKSVIAAGRTQPTWVHELVMLINKELGNLGNTITFKESKDTTYSDLSKFKSLMASIDNNNIDTLIIIGGNPVYDAPADFDFKYAISKIQHTVHLSSHKDETSNEVEWHVPRAHFLESWGDARSTDGTASVVQPMIEPLFGGHPDVEFYALLTTGRDIRGYDIVRDTWREKIGTYDFEKKWREVLHDGVLENSSLKDIQPRFKSSFAYSTDDNKAENLSYNNLELSFYPSQLYDGRFANNGWLQELPDAITRLAWDNAALISPNTSQELGVSSFEMVRVEYDGKTLELPAWVSPGQADNTVAIALGYGRTLAGKVGNNVGFNAYILRSFNNVHFASGAKVTGTGQNYLLANVQDHHGMEGRPLIREATLDEYHENPGFAGEMVHHPPLKSIYPDFDYSKGYQWGMSIDLNTCIGCNACVIACQSENNVQIVGKDQVEKGREMHWIRNDRYFEGDIEDPQMLHMPVPCQQCENAPCESVCPVAATVHDNEGLNVMTYNRCIGTRYCSNNCPYKVRRFNFFDYIKDMPEVEKMAQNPDVTVRSRGVMEKCTFCIQRINRAKNTAKLEGRDVKDGEFQTACQQVCPTQAIQFGNINDPNSKIAKIKNKDRTYHLLGEYNTRPRTSYLAKVRNPNPELVTKKSKEHKHS